MANSALRRTLMKSRGAQWSWRLKSYQNVWRCLWIYSMRRSPMSWWVTVNHMNIIPLINDTHTYSIPACHSESRPGLWKLFIWAERDPREILPEELPESPICPLSSSYSKPRNIWHIKWWVSIEEELIIIMYILIKIWFISNYLQRAGLPKSWLERISIFLKTKKSIGLQETSPRINMTRRKERTRTRLHQLIK